MRIVGLIIIGVLILDGFVYSLLRPVFVIVPLLMLAGLGYYFYKKPKRFLFKDAGWSIGAGTEITQPEQPHKVDDVVLSEKALALGVLAIGSPGAGKTESVLIGLLNYFTLRQPRIGWAAFDGKGQLDVYQKAVAAGAKPDLMFSSELETSHSVNLMDGDSLDVADRLSKVLIGEAHSTTFYADEQRSVLLKIVPLLLQLGLRVNLRDLYVALSVEDAGRELLLLAEQRGVDEQTRRAAASWLEMDFNQRINNVKGMLNRLFVFVSGPFTDRLNDYHPDIVLDTAVAKGQRLYFHLPESKFSRDVAVMLIEQLAAIAKRRQQSDLENTHLYPLVFDDWGALFHPGFKPFSARCRSAKMPLSFMFQSRAQLQDVSPTYETELDDNIATKVMLRINGQETAEFACRLMGTYDTREVATSMLGERDGTSLTMRETPRLKPNDFKALNPGAAYISTLVQNSHETINALYKARFPLVDITGWQSVGLPLPTHDVADHSDDGLNLWLRFMTPDRMRELHKIMEQEAA